MCLCVCMVCTSQQNLRTLFGMNIMGCLFKEKNHGFLTCDLNDFKDIILSLASGVNQGVTLSPLSHFHSVSFHLVYTLIV